VEEEELGTARKRLEALARLARKDSSPYGKVCAVVPRRARILGAYTLVSLSLRLKDLTLAPR